MKKSYENESLEYYASLMDSEQQGYFDSLLKIGDEKFTEDVFAAISARQHLIYLTCNEEKRLIEYFKTFGKAKSMNVYTWDISRGIRSINKPDQPLELSGVLGSDFDDESLDEEGVLQYITKMIEKEKSVKNSKNSGSVFLLLDYHRYLDEDTCLPSVERNLKNISLGKSKVCTFLVGPKYASTLSLDAYLGILDFPYPSKYEILEEATVLAKSVISKVPSVSKELKTKEEDIVKACSGMTIQDVGAALCQSVVRKRSFDVSTIVGFKRQTIKKKGLLEFVDTSVTFDDVGGLDPLVNWFKNRKIAMSDEASNKRVDPVRGALLIGVPGGGKSLIAKAVAAYYGFPLLKMDFGSLFSSLQGDTEHNFREAIKLAEAQSPAVLWCDEIEKGTSGSKSSDETDGGTTARVMQSLLTWMQEKTAPVFMIGTANNHEAIAPEFLRRFDEVWFVDNPTNIGRKQIFEIQLKSRKIDMKNINLDTLVAMTEGYNGDEIRKAINESLLFSITNKTSVISTDDIINQITDIKSLGAKKSDEIKKIRAWAGSNCRLANSPEDDVLAKAIEAANKDQGKDILV